jgi:uncharacterized membrane protein YhaH (DUF805 family)
VLAILVQIAFLMGDPVNPGTLVTAGFVLSGIWALAMFVDLGFLRGTQGPNQYGPDPLAS